MSWQSTVYKRGSKELKNYNSLKYKFLKQFNYTCQSCRKRYSRKSGVLSLHHIIPRNQGGDDNWDNLILLCKSCHNLIECSPEKYRDYNSIAYEFASPKLKKDLRIKEKPIGLKWQSWVYGGAKNPLNAVKT